MQNPFETREIWFLTGSQGLYGPETLDQVAAQSRTIAETLDAAGDIPVRLLFQTSIGHLSWPTSVCIVFDQCR